MRTKREGIVLVTLFAVFFLSSIAWAVDCPIPDTGQTKCYDDDSEITCPSPGEPFYGQEPQYPCNPQSYTKLDSSGNDLPESATEWAMVRDNVTGLIWENKTDDWSIHEKIDSYDWQDAQDIFIATLNNTQFGGYNDWRLPSVIELSYIRNLDAYPPSINTDYFVNTSLGEYWSSTTYVCDPSYAWGVASYGCIGCKKSSNGLNDRKVRAVRGEQCESFGNFVDNGNGTVTDTFTGLMWQQDAQNDYTWDQALSYCENLILANHTDWRLPDVNELQSLVDYSKCNPSIDPVFPNIMSGCYWSSTTYADRPLGAWYVCFGEGFVLEFDKSPYGDYVRAVRGGHCGSLDTSTTTTVASTTTTLSGSTTSTISGSTTTTVEPCPTETLYGEHSEEAELLRYFRDNVLSQTPEGRELIKFYYELSASIVKAMEEDEEFKAQVKEMIDGVLPLIR
jgi:hypothetical protein